MANCRKVTSPADKLNNTIRTTVPFKIGQRHTTSPVEKAGVQDLRIYDRALKPEEIKALARGHAGYMAWLLAKPGKTDDKEKDELYDGWLAHIRHGISTATVAPKIDGVGNRGSGHQERAAPRRW